MVSHMTPFPKYRYYLEWMRKELVKQGGVIFERLRVECLDEYCRGSVYDAVVNCTGLGSLSLAQDSALYPVRGQVIMPSSYIWACC